MSKIRTYLRNLVANWIGYGANMLLTLVTSWFVFHLLGDVRYGIWSLMLSLTGYLGMVDLGVRPALYRYFNWYLGRGEPNRVNQVLCTSLAFFAAASCVLLVAGIILGALFGSIFPKTPPEYLNEVGIAIVFTALNVGLSALAGVFGSLLETKERYDLSNLLDIAVMVVRSSAAILAIYLGFGLIGLAIACAGATVIACMGGYFMASRAFPEMAIRYGHVTRAMLAELIRFGIPCFFSGIGVRIVAFTSPILIAWLIDMPTVGYYSLAVMLLDYGRTLAQRGGTVFTPAIQQSLARQDDAGVRYLVPQVTRITMGIAVLVLVGALAFGGNFLHLVYGAAVAEAAGPVLGIMFIGYLVSSASQQCGAALIGANRVRLMAVVALTEALLNVGLTILLVGVIGMGLPGVAMGTAIPMTLMSGLVLSALGARQIGMKWGAFARQTAAYWVPSAALFWLVCLALAHGLAYASWAWFAAKVAAACMLYVPIAWFLILPRDQQDRLRGWLVSIWRDRKGRAAGSAAPATDPPQEPV